MTREWLKSPTSYFTFSFVKIAKNLRVGFMKHVDLLQQTDEKRFVVDVGAAVLLLFVLAFIVFVQVIFGARFIWSRAIIRRVHHVIRCVVDQQIVETEHKKEPKKEREWKLKQK